MKALSLPVSRIAAWAAVCLALPAAAEWSYDPSAQTLTQGSVVLANVTANGAKLTIGNNKSNTTAVALDFSTGVADGYEIDRFAQDAFNGNKNVTALVLPDTLTYVGQSAFLGCSNLGGTLVLPDSLTSTGNHPFYGTGLTRVEFGSGLKTVSNWMFHQCAKLRTVGWNPAVTAVNEKGFYGCSALLSFDGEGTWHGFPTNLVTIGSAAFFLNGYANSLPNVDVRLPALRTLGSEAFRASGIRSLEVGGGCTTVGSHATRVCLKLESAVFHEGTATISDGAFGWCTSITNLVLPSTVRKVGAITGATWGTANLHVWWNGVPDASQVNFASASGDNWSLLRGQTPTVHHVRWKDRAAWEAFSAAIPADYAADNALSLPPEAKKVSVGSWGTAGNQPVLWFDLPPALVVFIR